MTISSDIITSMGILGIDRNDHESLSQSYTLLVSETAYRVLFTNASVNTLRMSNTCFL